MPADASPVFQKAYKKQQGNLAGIRLRGKFRTAFNQWEGRNGDDPEAFQNFFSGFIKDNVSSEDPDVLRGLNPHVDQMLERGYNQHAIERAERVYKDSVGTHGATINEDIGAAVDEGEASEEGTDYEAIWERTKAVRGEALRSGIRREDMDAQIVQSIIDKAVETGDEKLLDLLDKKLPGYDHKLSDMPQYRGIKQRALEKLDVAARRREISDERKQKAFDKERKDKIVTSVSRAISQNPSADIPEDIIREWEKYDASARSRLADIKTKLTNGGPESDRDLLQVQQAIREGGGEQAINKAVRHGIITNPKTYASMLDRVDKYRKLEGSGNGSAVLKSATVKRYLKAIATRTIDPLEISTIFGGNGMTNDGFQATEDFNDAVVEWQLAHPDDSFLERERSINEIGKHILGHIKVVAEFRTSG